MGVDGQHAGRTVLDELRPWPPVAWVPPPAAHALVPSRWLGLQQAELAGEVARLLEALVDAGETDGGDVIERPQPLEHGKAELFARDLAAG